MTHDDAADTGRDALIWLARNPDALAGFLATGGGSIDDLSARSHDPEFLGFVLDYVLSSETLVLDFARDLGVDPETPMLARTRLPGGDAPAWT